LWRDSKNPPYRYSGKGMKRRGLKKVVEHLIPANRAFIRPSLLVGYPYHQNLHGGS
jgi:hypothetical protein